MPLRWFAILLFLFGFEFTKVSVKEITYKCEGVKIVTRKEWKARNAVRTREISLPINHVIILHTVTEMCNSKMQCSEKVQLMQDMHLDDRGWWDIAYNFLVGGDGQIYQGRGWNLTGAHAVNYNTNSLGVGFIGNFNNDIPTEAMLNATQKLIDCGVKKGYLTPTREIHGHKDVTCTESPGNNLYKEIRLWKNFKGGRLPMYSCGPLKRPVVNEDIITDNKQ